MYDTFKLSAAARGYRVAGRKLLPRDASAFQFGKSNRERKRHVAAEKAHNDKYNEAYGYTDRSMLRIERTRKTLGTRSAKLVEFSFHNMVTSDDQDEIYERTQALMGRAEWRYFNALYDAHCAELARYAADHGY